VPHNRLAAHRNNAGSDENVKKSINVTFLNPRSPQRFELVTLFNFLNPFFPDMGRTPDRKQSELAVYVWRDLWLPPNRWKRKNYPPGMHGPRGLRPETIRLRIAARE